MILLDSNLLIYATAPGFKQHPAAARWLEDVLNGHDRVGMPWHSLLSYFRITTNPRLFRQPAPPEIVWSRVRDWLALPLVWIPAPTAQHAQILGQLVTRELSNGELIMDAHLAALAIEHGLTLCSSDRDFSRFAGLKWRNPLTASH